MSDTCKIVLVGDAGTGKTCIISRFVNERFDKAQMSTACPSFCNKSVSYPKYNKTINIDIWDTAGQEIYRSISKLFYNGASIGILVYDITNKNSFVSLKEYWYKELKENTSLVEQFRNELINREETYNGYFDRKPKVGYVDPLKVKKENDKKHLKSIKK